MGCSRRTKVKDLRPEQKWDFIVRIPSTPLFVQHINKLHSLSRISKQRRFSSTSHTDTSTYRFLFR